MVYAGYLVVEDRKGARFRVRKFCGRRFFKPIVRYVLDTGQRLEPIDSDTFQVAATGEKLLQVR
jgi:hypothetical protein